MGAHWNEIPWERQPCDDALSWDLFQGYLALPCPRVIASLAKRPGCPIPAASIQDIARRNWWERRAELWDVHLSEIRITTVERVTGEDAEARARRHAGIARRALRVVERQLTAIESVQEKAPDLPLGADYLPAAVMARLLHWGVLVERLACGDSTERTEATVINHGPDPLANLTVEELRALRGLQDKAGVE